MIDRLLVHNYRCLFQFELKLDGKPSALLFGPNGSGKSTVGSALQLLQSLGRGTSRLRDLVSPSDLGASRTVPSIVFDIQATIDGRTYAYVLTVELPVGAQEFKVFTEYLTVNGEAVLTRNIDQVHFGLLTETHPAFVSVDLNTVALPVLLGASKPSTLHPFREWLSNMLILAPQPMRMSGEAHTETAHPLSSLENFTGWLAHLKHCPAVVEQSIQDYLSGLIPDFAGFGYRSDGPNGSRWYVDFSHNGKLVRLPFEALSDGEKCFFVCAAVIASNKHMGPRFCFWDEPDNYLAISEVGHFVMSLRRAFQSGGQLLIASHNAQAIRQFSDENTFVLQRSGHFEPPTVRLLSDMEYTGDLVGALVRNDLVAAP